jgi:hypothetical protein
MVGQKKSGGTGKISGSTGFRMSASWAERDMEKLYARAGKKVSRN